MVAVVACTLVLSSCATNSRRQATTVAAGKLEVTAPPTGVVRTEPLMSTDLLEQAIQRMVAPDIGGKPLKIIEVVGPVQGWVAVSVSPPYREFPTVVLFRFVRDGTLQRVFEALMPGVQPTRSDLLDLHTKGKAFDYTVGKDSWVTLDSMANVVLASRRRQLVTVAHAYFFHAHPAGANDYFVDRTATYDLARRLFPGAYEKYPHDECTMFDVPALVRIDLRSRGESLVLTVQTDNGQTWRIGWNGADDRGFLTAKTVDAN